MKLRSTVGLAFVLLMMMLGAGAVSALWGYTLGHEALKSVSRPTANPIRKLADQSSEEPKEFTIVSEKEILVRVYDRTHGKKETESGSSSQSSESTQNLTEPPQPDEDKSSLIKFSEEPSPSEGFPFKAQDQGVVLEVLEASPKKRSLSLNVKLKNNGPKKVRFLYSFLEIRNDKNQVLGAITDGLPSQLPATGENFSGTVSIPMSLLDDSQKISLMLTDYPDRNLQLKIPEIPVVRVR